MVRWCRPNQISTEGATATTVVIRDLAADFLGQSAARQHRVHQGRSDDHVIDGGIDRGREPKCVNGHAQFHQSASDSLLHTGGHDDEIWVQVDDGLVVDPGVLAYNRSRNVCITMAVSGNSHQAVSRPDVDDGLVGGGQQGNHPLGRAGPFESVAEGFVCDQRTITGITLPSTSTRRTASPKVATRAGLPITESGTPSATRVP